MFTIPYLNSILRPSARTCPSVLVYVHTIYVWEDLNQVRSEFDALWISQAVSDTL